MSIHPVLLSSLLADVVRHGEAEAARIHGLDGYALVGLLPAEVALPSQRTVASIRPPPPGLADAGLELDMVCWPLRRRLPVGRTTVTVGRDPKGDIVIPHAAVSHAHARFRVGADDVTVEDLGSTLGTRIGAQPLAPAGERTLSDGDRVSLGELPLQFMTARRLLALLLGG
ncbi:MAG: FHA domain-containing protein [Deltaproteobacteria bacterium]|nr:FHA domain-containing protein [Deltaproteobacteria bacterium]